ncbi:hypothetical protein [Effusibacillus consociatus]|uniref:DUF5808 domain-containing protein n=1 Tax=Effusibacillus consociatus TaxID=1117041 RepID=A0ABV9Q7P4_9BACL
MKASIKAGYGDHRLDRDHDEMLANNTGAVWFPNFTYGGTTMRIYFHWKPFLIVVGTFTAVVMLVKLFQG